MLRKPGCNTQLNKLRFEPCMPTNVSNGQPGRNSTSLGASTTSKVERVVGMDSKQSERVTATPDSLRVRHKAVRKCHVNILWLSAKYTGTSSSLMEHTLHGTKLSTDGHAQEIPTFAKTLAGTSLYAKEKCSVFLWAFQIIIYTVSFMLASNTVVGNPVN